MGKNYAYTRSGSGAETIKHTHLAEKASVGHHAQHHGPAIIPSGQHGYETHANKVRASGQIGGKAHNLSHRGKHSSDPLSFTAGSGKSTIK
jgi:hypothetical protein